MKENSKAPFLAICLFLLLTIPLDRAVNAAADIVANRGLDTNWFFGMDHAFQSAIVAIVPTFFGYLLFKHIEELKENPSSEMVVMKAVFAALFVVMFTVTGCGFLSLTAETRGTLRTDTISNLLMSSLAIGAADGLMMAGMTGIIACFFLKRIQRELIDKKESKDNEKPC